MLKTNLLFQNSSPSVRPRCRLKFVVAVRLISHLGVTRQNLALRLRRVVRVRMHAATTRTLARRGSIPRRKSTRHPTSSVLLSLNKLGQSVVRRSCTPGICPPLRSGTDQPFALVLSTLPLCRSTETLILNPSISSSNTRRTKCELGG